MKKRKYVEIQYNTDNIQIMCITNVSYSTVIKHKTHVQSDQSDKLKIKALYHELVLSLR